MISYDITGILNGDFLIGESDLTHIEDILKLGKGQLYEYPILGYDINKKVNGSLVAIDEKRKIRDELTRDNFIVSKLTIDKNFKIDIEAEKRK